MTEDVLLPMRSIRILFFNYCIAISLWFNYILIKDPRWLLASSLASYLRRPGIESCRGTFKKLMYFDFLLNIFAPDLEPTIHITEDFHIHKIAAKIQYSFFPLSQSYIPWFMCQRFTPHLYALPLPIKTKLSH